MYSIQWTSPRGMRKSKKKYTAEEAKKAVDEITAHLKLMGHLVPTYQVVYE